MVCFCEFIMSNELLSKQNFKKSAALYIKQLKQNKNNADALNMLGATLIALKKTHFAASFIKKALELEPDNPYILNNLGLAYFSAGDLNKAESIFEKINNLKPDFTSAANTLLKIYQTKKEHQKALQLIIQQQTIFPDNPALKIIQGCIYTDIKEYKKAYDIFKNIYQVNTKDFLTTWYYGICAYNLNKNEQAIQLFETAIQINDQHPVVWNNLGTALTKRESRNYRSELYSYHKAIKLKPDFYDAYNNYALTLIIANKINLAQKILKKLNAIYPDNIQAKMNLALTYRILGELDAASDIYLDIIKKEPNNRLTKANLAFNYLTAGHLHKGWQYYEERWALPDLQKFNTPFEQPLWQGEDLNGKTLLIACEQGFGDAIQFVRYIPLINKGTGKIILACRKPIFSLLKTVKNVDQVINIEMNKIQHDVYIPLLSLPRIFNTELENIPQNVPYLSIDSKKQKKWQDFFVDYKDDFKIGINWAGNPRHKLDLHRSVKPKYFEKLNINPSIKLFSLQRDNAYDACKKYGFISLGDKFSDFSDTAACLSCLDLTISVDTAIAHLAGALNLPIWTVLGFYNDWRWLQHRQDSPWYPSMHLFRQPKRNDWNSVFDDMIIKLDNLVKEKHG